MSKITVLVAVYNAEKYLRTCLDSLCNQTLKDIQIVCIDDCSQDSSYEILNEYAKKDDRILIIQTQSNSGQAIARNEGLKFADGEYTTMLDSDDWYAPDSLERIYNIAKTDENIDCAAFRLVLHDEKSGKETDYKISTSKKIISGEEAFKLSLDWSLHGLYIVKTPIHKEYPYDTSCKLYSDDNTTRIHYLHSRKVAITYAPYFYRKHEESMTNSCSIRRFDHMDANLSMKKLLESEIKMGYIADAANILNIYETNRWLNVVGCYWFYHKNKSKFSKEEKEEIKLRFSNILSTIERNRVSLRTKIKLGYYPIKSFRLFCFIEESYFFIRKALYFICMKDYKKF